MKTSAVHGDAVAAMLSKRPALVREYLRAAMAAINEPGGERALLSALRNIAQAQGMSVVAKRAAMPRESLTRALSEKGNPTVKTLLSVLHGSGIELSMKIANGAARGQRITKDDRPRASLQSASL